MFSKKVDRNNNKEMFYFLKEHFTYWTMDSWNNLSSIANNVKLYNLQLTNWEKALEILEIEEYFTINSMIKDWEHEYIGYEVGFNGRSGGYLVLTEKNKNGNILDNYITDNDTYEDFKEDIKEYYGTLKEYHNELVEQVDLVCSFDRLCDNLREELQYMIDNATIEEETIMIPKTIKKIVYND